MHRLLPELTFLESDLHVARMAKVSPRAVTPIDPRIINNVAAEISFFMDLYVSTYIPEKMHIMPAAQKVGDKSFSFVLR